jgi:hypothetical protein
MMRPNAWRVIRVLLRVQAMAWCVRLGLVDGGLAMQSANKGPLNHDVSQVRTIGSGCASHHPGSTAANCRTKGISAKSVAQGELPPRYGCACNRASSGPSKASTAKLRCTSRDRASPP